MECDFCNDVPAEACYPVSTPLVVEATVNAVLVVDSDRWVACEACRQLIADDDRDGLFRRAVQAMAEQAPEGMAFEEIVLLVRRIQTAFFAANPVGVGPAV
ncbi:MAG: hypothetical protein KGJ86_14605 [Chloroflexota bacterium]|nr:hypothetical protein [Chloroflexota bacterium]